MYRLLCLCLVVFSKVCQAPIPRLSETPPTEVVLSSGAQGIIYSSHLHKEQVVVKKAKHHSMVHYIESEACFLAQFGQWHQPYFPKLYGMTSDKHLVMAKLDGMNGQQLLKFQKHRYYKDTVKLVIRELVKALKLLAKKGIIHNDVSLQNFILEPNMTVKLIDFGLATHVGDPLHRPFMLSRTPPEFKNILRTSKGQILPAADLYSVGCLLFHLIKGKRIFDYDYEMYMIEHTLEQKIQLKKSKWFVAGNPASFYDLLYKLLQPQPEHRPLHDEILAHPYLRASGSTVIRL